MTTIYYFTGTGNSQMIAEELAARLPDCKTEKITPELAKGTSVSGCAGVAFPVYFLGLPHIVREFLTNAEIQKGTYCFAVANMGNMTGNALPFIRKILKTKGVCLQAEYAIKMPENYTPMFKPETNAEQKKLFHAARQKIKVIADDVRNRRKLKPKFYHPLFNVYHNFMHRDIAKMDKNFTVQSTCNGCGKCKKICPVSNISIENGIPEWHHNCEYCFACLHYCPQKAINCGKNTINRERYQNPYIKR